MIEIRIGYKFFNDIKKSLVSWLIVSVCEISFGVLIVYIRVLVVVF